MQWVWSGHHCRSVFELRLVSCRTHHTSLLRPSLILRLYVNVSLDLLLIVICSWFSTLHIILFRLISIALPFLVNWGWRVLMVGNLINIEVVAVVVEVLRTGFGMQYSWILLFIVISFASPCSSLRLGCKLIPLIVDIAHKSSVGIYGLLKMCPDSSWCFGILVIVHVAD